MPSNGTIALQKTHGTFYNQYNTFTAAYTKNDDNFNSYVRLSYPQQMEDTSSAAFEAIQPSTRP